MSTLDGRQFEIIVCSGVIYMMLKPFYAILKCRRLLSLIALASIIVLTFTMKCTRLKILTPRKTRYIYWMSIRSAIRVMLQITGIDSLAKLTVSNLYGHTILARNVPWIIEICYRSQVCYSMPDNGLFSTGITELPTEMPKESNS